MVSWRSTGSMIGKELPADSAPRSSSPAYMPVYLSSPEIPEHDDSHSQHHGEPQANLPLIDETTLVARTPARGKGG